MNRTSDLGARKPGGVILIAALALTAVSAFAQTSIDYDFGRKIYTAGHDDLYKVEVGLKNTAYWLLNDSLKSDKPIDCDKTKQDCSPASFRLVEVIDTAKTDAFFQRHEILEAPDAKSFLSKPPHYASKYVLYIGPYVALKIMSDTLVNRLVDLEPGLKTVTSLGRGKPRAHGHRSFAGYPTGQWLLGRNTGPRPEAISRLP